MKLEDQVCTLKQAQKLVKLGLVLGTTYVWQKRGSDYQLASRYNLAAKSKDSFPAPNVAELGVLLPAGLMIEDAHHWLETNKADASFLTGYIQKANTPHSSHDELWVCKFIKETEAQARADALIWLIENGFVKVGSLKL